MSVEKKSYIESIRPYVPGKPIEEVKKELGLTDVIKLASNENPLGVSSVVKERLMRELDEINRYPDGGTVALRAKLAGVLGVAPDELIMGNGSNELIDFAARGFINEGDEVISSAYAFLVYPLLTQICGATFIEVPMHDFRFDLEAIAARITAKTKMIFLANPNNPTGTYFTRIEWEQFLEKVPASVMICLDEAYVDFVEAPDYPNGLEYFRKRQIIVLRTFSKSMGLAGLRIGFGVAARAVITYLNKIRQPFNVNMLAQIAASAALDDAAYLEASQKAVIEGRTFFYKAFAQMGIDYIKSQANFVLIDVRQDSAAFFQKCLRHGLIVRDMKAYKLDTFVRISIGTLEENKKAVAIIREVLK